jgi:hypothetical protein
MTRHDLHIQQLVVDVGPKVFTVRGLLKHTIKGYVPVYYFFQF